MCACVCVYIHIYIHDKIYYNYMKERELRILKHFTYQDIDLN